MSKPLLKYKIGLAVIGLLTLGLLITLIGQAGTVKQDAETFKKATKVADSLNKYTQSNSVPKSLEAAKINDVPASVTYKYLSSDRYEFCVTYKADSDGFNTSGLETQLLAAGLGGSPASYYKALDKPSESSYLYVDSYYHKGKNCQTVQPYTFNSNFNFPSGSSSSSSSSSSAGSSSASSGSFGSIPAYESCDRDANGNKTSNDAYFACLKNLQNNSGAVN